jgi:hypothetical protein
MGKVSDYCPAHDYGDPGFPPDECPACKALNAPDMIAESAEAALKEARELIAELQTWHDRKEQLLDAYEQRVSVLEKTIENQNRVIADFWEQHKRDDALFIMHPEDARLKAITEMREWRTRAERYREALVKAEAFLDENYYRLAMSGREAAALATIRIALQQGKGEG